MSILALKFAVVEPYRKIRGIPAVHARCGDSRLSVQFRIAMDMPNIVERLGALGSLDFACSIFEEPLADELPGDLKRADSGENQGFDLRVLGEIGGVGDAESERPSSKL